MATDTLPDAGAMESGLDVRLAARAGFDGVTVGRAPGHVQANLVLLPESDAAAFAGFCRANPAALPLLAVGEPGSWTLPALGRNIDLRTDLPGYLIHEHGKARPAAEIVQDWRDDLVAIATGCWFGAEAALRRAGIRLRHSELGVQGPLFRTDRRTVPHGRFGAELVVSMRPFARSDVPRIRAITARLPLCHGAPLHEGDPATLGIADPDRPDWGERLAVEPGETALFWACGLTALAALQKAALPCFITHAPGAMLVTDLMDDNPC